MSRNVTILIIILVILLIAGYLLWLRGRFQTTQVAPAPTQSQEVATPTPQQVVASPSATATPSGVRVSPTTRISTGSGSTTR